MSEPEREIIERASRIRMVLMDVDGVLTDGKLYLGPNGFDARTFHTRDGQGIRLGQRGGLLFGIISGREAQVVAERAAELYITEVHQGVYDKAERLDDILRRTRIEADAVCFMGDDLVDVPVMRRVGLAAAPSDAATVALEAAHLVTRAAGGHGAVREVVDLVLRATDQWDRVVGRFLR